MAGRLAALAGWLRRLVARRPDWPGLLRRHRQDRQDRQSSTLLPFELVKYFSFTSLALILIASFILSWVIASNAKTVLLQRSEAYSRLFADNLARFLDGRPLREVVDRAAGY